MTKDEFNGLFQSAVDKASSEVTFDKFLPTKESDQINYNDFVSRTLTYLTAYQTSVLHSLFEALLFSELFPGSQDSSD